MNTKTKATKDKWDKLDIIGKGLAGVFVSAAITYYGISSSNKQAQIAEENRKNQFQIAEENRKAQIIVQTMGNREAASADLKAKMFSALMEYYLKKQDDPASQRIIVELIGLNFQEHLRLKPLLEKLEIELSSNKDELLKLQKAAKNMSRIEIDNIIGNGGSVCKVTLQLNKTQSPLPEECQLPISLTLREVNESGVRVSTNDNDNDGFSVNYYDMPLVDNTTLGDFTYSIVLSSVDVEAKMADIKVVILPEHFYSARHGLHFDQIIGDWITSDIKN